LTEIHWIFKFKRIKRNKKNKDHQKSSGGAINPTGGRPVFGSVPLGLLKSRICGSGLWIS